MNEINFVWYPASGNETKTVDVLKDEGANIRSGLGFEPLTMIATALGITSLVGAIVKLYRDARYSGVMIDATRDPVEIKEMPNWSRKQVLVITPAGAQLLSAGADKSGADELGKIADILKNLTRSVAREINE